MFIDRIAKIIKLRKTEAALIQIQEEIKTWDFVNQSPNAVIKGIFDAIRENKSLLEYYFQEIDWKTVDVDLVYELLFNEEQKEKSGKRRKTRVIKEIS